jgi:hypothetical protein
MKWTHLAVLGLLIAMAGCIGDDIIEDAVDESVRITSQLDELAVGDTYKFTARYTNNVGIIEQADIVWTSSAEDVLTIDDTGLASGIEEGDATVTAKVILADKTVSDSRLVTVTDTTIVGNPDVRTGSLTTTSNYTLQGNFALERDGDDFVLSLDESYEASSALPGLYVYLGNNPATTNGAYEIAEVEVFGGAHAYVIPGDDIALDEFEYVLYWCKPFNVKVGEGDFEN